MYKFSVQIRLDLIAMFNYNLIFCLKVCLLIGLLILMMYDI